MLLMSDALYNGIVGAGGTLFCYLLYLLFKYLFSKYNTWRKMKSCAKQNKVNNDNSTDECISSNEMPKQIECPSNCSVNYLSEEMEEKISEKDSKSSTNIIEQEKTKSNQIISSKSKTKSPQLINIKNVILYIIKYLAIYTIVAVIVFAFGGIFAIIFWGVQGSVMDNIYFDTYKSDWLFWMPFILAVLPPLILYQFKNKSAKKCLKLTGILVGIAFIISSGIFYLRLLYAKKFKAEYEEVSSKEYIQRNFYGCSFGDKNISKKLKEKGYKIECSVPHEYVEIQKVDFGGYEMDTVRFILYNEKFNSIILIKNITDEDYNTYNAIYRDVEIRYNEIEEDAKNWCDNHNLHYESFFNHELNEWSDKNTKLTLMQYPELVLLRYYDKHSKYEEDLENYYDELREDF